MKRISVASIASALLLTCTGSVLAGDGKPEQEALSLLREYIGIDTTNPPGNEIRAAEFFKAIFDREGIESRTFESAPGRGNVYARIKGDGSERAIVLLSHMDVVPADRRHWSVDPFAAVVKDGYLWGRGALDVKGLGILNLMAMLTLKREGVPLKSDVIFLGTADEEAGGAMGAGYMTREHFDLVQDAGLVINEFGFISIGEDGKPRYYGASPAEKAPFWLKLTATGTPGHGSAPRPDSAVLKLIEALHRIASYQTVLSVDPVAQKFFADIADLEPVPARREKLKDLRASLGDPAFAAEFTKDLRNNATVRNTISITMLDGSNKVNVIPAEASAQLDVRLLPGQDPALFLEDLKQVISDDAIRIEPVMAFPPTSSPSDSEFYRVLQGLADEIDPGIKVTTPLLTGFTDCHFFREKGIPCYGFIPFRLPAKELGGVHGNDERLSLENVAFGTRTMIELVRRLATQ
ncbi:MAG TPA: M20/M25/M40 family metallo-hydrolase [Burkholderiales bacterium]|nr:M20/M25/M40 family metallo-hydrolase [Burkholderiales bacterium]